MTEMAREHRWAGGAVSAGWQDVVARYRPGDVVPPLVGSAAITVDSVDPDRICLRQRLWHACLTPDEFTTATDLLATAGPRTGLELAELLRRHYAGGPRVTTDCTRVPNLCAVLLADMGAIEAR